MIPVLRKVDQLSINNIHFANLKNSICFQLNVHEN